MLPQIAFTDLLGESHSPKQMGCGEKVYLPVPGLYFEAE